MYIRSYPVQTSQGTAACEAVAPSGPAHSILLALLWTVRATGGRGHGRDWGDRNVTAVGVNMLSQQSPVGHRGEVASQGNNEGEN